MRSTQNVMDVSFFCSEEVEMIVMNKEPLTEARIR